MTDTAVRLDTRTLRVLKNFTTINTTLAVDPGSVISTMSPGRSIVARATLPDVVFPVPFAIGDLTRFLGVLSLFDSPELQFGEKSVTVTGGGKRVTYAYAAPESVARAPNTINPPPFEVEFELTPSILSDALKGIGVLGYQDLAVVGEGGRLSLRAFSDKLSDTFDVVVGETEHDFRMVFRAENLKLLPETYRMRVSSKGLAHLEAPDIQYWIAVEADKSKFNG